MLTGGPVVDAVWRRLLDRAGPRPGWPLTDDPDLHLLVDGVRADRLRMESLGAGAGQTHGRAHIFALADAPKSVRIVSRASVPAELGLLRDFRCLGIALRRLVLHQGPRIRVIEAVDALLTEGFHSYEDANQYRWTDGDAALPAALLANFAGPFELVLHIGNTAQYSRRWPRQPSGVSGDYNARSP